MMTYFNIEQDGSFNYSLRFNDNFYKVFEPYYKGDSYWNLLYRLFGMLPQDFYHYVGATYHALFKPSPYVKTVIYMYFKKKEHAIQLANEIDKRINYCVERGDFE